MTDQSLDVKDNYTLEQQRLLSLIEFAQQSARLKLTPVKEVSKHKILSLFEHEFTGLPGIHFNSNSEDDDVWLSIERLRESQPPKPKSELLQVWIDLSNKPEKEPSLKKAAEFCKPDEMKVTEKKKNKKDNGTTETSLVLFSDFDQRENVENQLKQYIENHWRPWAAEEKKRLRTIRIYSELFTLKQQLEGAISDVQIELLWGMGIGIWRTEKFSICYPLIIQAVNISLNESNMSLEIRPGEADSSLDLEAYIDIDNPGVPTLERAYKNFIDKQSQVFSPFDRISYESILQVATTHLDSKGVYWPDQTSAEDRQLPKAEAELKITDTWVLFARPRSKSSFIQDLENFKNGLDDPKLSNVVKAIVSEPSTEHAEINLPRFRGLSDYGVSVDEKSVAADLFFPMSFNEEQVNIVQRLECSDGVVVQGPPGTGKTHTIANIISHYLANGKRVLVTSMKEPALTVLKEKLPEAIQPLAISLLVNEQDGAKQFEFSVTKIAQELQIIDRRNLSFDITNLEHKLNELHARLALLNRSINSWAKKNIEIITLDKQTITPEVAAQEVISGAGQYEWLDDELSINTANDPKFNNTDILKLREARRILNKDLDYIDSHLPEINTFPTSIELLQIHNELCKNNKLKTLIETATIPALINASNEVIEKAAFLLDILLEYEAIKSTLLAKNKAWILSVKQHLQKGESLQLIALFEKIIEDIKVFFTEKNAFLEKPVYLPDDLELTEEVIQAISNKANDKSAFLLGGILGKRQLQSKLNQIKIINSFAKEQDEWKHIHRYVLLLCRSKELILRWNSIASELEITLLELDRPETSFKIAKEELEIYQLLKQHCEQEQQLSAECQAICPGWPYYHEIALVLHRSKELYDILETHVNYHRSLKAWNSKEKLQNLLLNYNGRICNSIKQFFNEKLGNPLISEMQVQTEWLDLIEELKRVLTLRGYLLGVKEISDRIANSGAHQWARKILTEPMLHTTDSILPDNWQQAWRLCRLSNYLASTNSHDEFKLLSKQHKDAEKALAKIYQDIVVKRTWLKLAENATPEVKAALQAFRAAISRIGKGGTGKRAVRYRRDARNASALINKAIPCWIMPHYRVSESLPPTFACFDLVVIDEASQSDLSALPAIFRANKILIVGDDKQVSPEGIGLEEAKIITLKKRYLANQVEIYSQAMTPERSIYDLFKVVFADSQIMLREHFRCVSPIIEYSKREFYNHELKPVRLPKQSERLDPPLIDVLVEDGFRQNKENLAEAKFIVEEIRRITEEPTMQHLSIGVISLLGNEQARKIWELLENTLGPEVIARHHIASGDAKSFQGKERNIIFLSMVATKDNSHADSKEASNQRFNVAASRARDRMYLVRSIELDELSPADKLRRNLIQHFHSPFAQSEEGVKDLRTLCESNFEREVYDLLTERGYKVTPQVKVGAYRIDMVVEGHQDKRLAIECDGDQYHDISRWEADMDRQRKLERVGWQFWRCFASTFVMNKNAVINDLINTLSDYGIEPIGAEGLLNSIHSEQRRVKVFIDKNEVDVLSN